MLEGMWDLGVRDIQCGRGRESHIMTFEDQDPIGDLIIKRNSAKCGLCNVEVTSKHVHDFRWCDCGNVSVDGGYHYLNHGWRDGNYYTNTSVTVDRSKD